MMYVFDVVEFIESCERDGATRSEIAKHMEWAVECHDKKVNMINDSIGMVGEYIVSIDWCREAGEKVLVFSKELYLQDTNLPKNWTNEIDGEIVEFDGEHECIGFCKNYLVSRDWCEEVIL